MPERIKLIGYCGLYCGDCAAHTQTVANLTRDLRRELRRHKFDKAARALAKMRAFKAFKHYEKGYELLGAMMKIRCKNPCREGGWAPGCRIKKCALERGFDGCWECDSFEDCKKLKVLEEGNDFTHLKNLRKLKRMGPVAFIKAKSQSSPAGEST
jgi:hypothetical protein